MRNTAKDIEEICEEIREEYDAYERGRLAEYWEIIYGMLKSNDLIRIPTTKAGEYITECNQKMTSDKG